MADDSAVELSRLILTALNASERNPFELWVEARREVNRYFMPAVRKETTS